MIVISYHTPLHRYVQLAKYAQDNGLTLEHTISVMIDDFLCRQRLLADEVRASGRNLI
jgi:hypothetical protein